MSQIVALFAVFLPVTMLSVFSFVAVVVWSENRRKEREAYYHSEVMKKIAESSGDAARYALEMMREKEAVRQRRQREGLVLGGAVNMAVGLGLTILLSGLAGGKVFLVGVMPFLIGVVLLLYGQFIAERGPSQHRD